MITQDQVLDIFKENGVMLEGHFILTSGRHSDRYMQCAHIYEHPQSAAQITERIASQLSGQTIDVVIGPAVGGINIAYELARQLGARTIFSERVEGKMALRRDFHLQPTDRVVVAEDVITTGGSVREVIELIKESGATLVAVGVAVDRSAGKVDFGVPLYSAVSMEVTSWEAEECPLCKQGSEAVKPGSRGLK